MQKLYYQFPGTWFGDCMPFGHGDKFYLYHQRDTRKPGPFGEPFGWDLATTSDFVHYEDKGVAIPRGTDEEQDQFIFAGSVFDIDPEVPLTQDMRLIVIANRAKLNKLK